VDRVDVLIIGAGISGIAAAYYLQRELPEKSFVVVDGRDAVGGTWDLFRYPGIRSDSDLHTFGFAFKPWTSDYSIAGAPEILAYLNEAVDENGLRDKIRFGRRVTSVSWDSDTATWTVTATDTSSGTSTEINCGFIFAGTGYYDYSGGYVPEFQGREQFRGQIVHPQAWPEDLDYAGKRIVVIGSGATAVTLIPAMAQKAAHITMLQRTPSYVMTLPEKDPIANGLRRVLPGEKAYALTRRFNIWRQRAVYNLCRNRPELARKLLRGMIKLQVGRGFELDPHFKPTYAPWDQRLCFVPNGDLFRTLRRGKASVVTDAIDHFTDSGILLRSGRVLDADIIVTATGLNMIPFGGIEMTVDGEPMAPSDRVVFRSMMLSDVPNFAYAFGYTNMSWTLKVDLVCEHFCRLLRRMDATGMDTVVPVADDPTLTRMPMLAFDSGYVQRAIDRLPKRGSHGPWTVEMSYEDDRARLIDGPVDDPALHFSASRAPVLT
jgi:monooxygenase